MVKEQEEMKCPKCGAYMKEFACSYKCRNLNCRYTYETFFFATANIQQQFQPDNGGECTRPDMVDCHAKGGTGGRCMNGVRCPPLQVKQMLYGHYAGNNKSFPDFVLKEKEWK